MKNASIIVRGYYKAALSGNVFNGQPLPIYDSYVYQVTTPNNYIEIRDVVESNVQNDAKFIIEVDVELEIVTTQYKNSSISLCESIAQKVYELILPKVGGDYIEFDDIQIGHIYLETSRNLFEVDEKGNYITRKLLTFRQLVTIK